MRPISIDRITREFRHEVSVFLGLYFLFEYFKRIKLELYEANNPRGEGMVQVLWLPQQSIGGVLPVDFVHPDVGEEDYRLYADWFDARSPEDILDQYATATPVPPLGFLEALKLVSERLDVSIDLAQGIYEIMNGPRSRGIYNIRDYRPDRLDPRFWRYDWSWDNPKIARARACLDDEGFWII